MLAAEVMFRILPKGAMPEVGEDNVLFRKRFTSRDHLKFPPISLARCRPVCDAVARSMRDNPPRHLHPAKESLVRELMGYARRQNTPLAVTQNLCALIFQFLSGAY